jgi:hypothetical protein
VTNPTRNGPCPCGSGVKYKKCCLPKQPPETERRRIVERRGQTMIVSRGVTPAMLDDAAEHFARRRERREGPAAQVMRFAAPLREAAGNDYQRTQRAMTVANDEGDATELRKMAAGMIARHREMFPDMHRGRPEHAEAGTGARP